MLLRRHVEECVGVVSGSWQVTASSPFTVGVVQDSAVCSEKAMSLATKAAKLLYKIPKAYFTNISLIVLLWLLRPECM